MLKKSFLSLLLILAAAIFLTPVSALAQRGGHSGGHGYSGGGGHSYSRGYSGGGRSYSAPSYRGGGHERYEHGYGYGGYGYRGGSYRGGYYAPRYYYSPGFSFGFGYGYPYSSCVPAGFYDAAGFWHYYAGCAGYPY